jgi:hypothetical protein
MTIKWFAERLYDRKADPLSKLWWITYGKSTLWIFILLKTFSNLFTIQYNEPFTHNPTKADKGGFAIANRRYIHSYGGLPIGESTLRVATNCQLR